MNNTEPAVPFVITSPMAAMGIPSFTLGWQIARFNNRRYVESRHVRQLSAGRASHLKAIARQRRQ
jgi:hypothetical protein